MTDALLTGRAGHQQSFFQAQQDTLRHLAEQGQAPPVLFITCADSRVTPEGLFGLDPGEWFMIRNVANIVPPYAHSDPGVAAALEFSVQVLKVQHIVVCGHTDCGGMAALLDPPPLSQMPGLNRWVELSRPALSRLPAGADRTTRQRILTERNVVLQLDHLRTYPTIRSAVEKKMLALHGWLYDLAAPAVLVYDPETDAFRA